MPRRLWTADVALAFCGALVLFATTATTFEARVTDLSALRVANGDVPYRDFWTMYAPGSFALLGAVFALFGRELLISNVLGIATSAAAVAAYYALARSVCGTATAAVLAALVAGAFFGTGYSDGFTSYPPAFLLIAAAACLVMERCVERGMRWAIAPALLLGVAALFKHDVGGYATLAVCGALPLARARGGARSVWTPSLLIAALVAMVVGAAAGLLIVLGAGSDAWRDLIRFPLIEFRYVRWENLPIVPRWHGSLVATARGSVGWSAANVPIVALVAGLYLLWRQRHDATAASLLVAAFGAIACGLHRAAAEVQLNTNAISLSAWAGLVAGVGVHAAGARTRSTAAGRVAAAAAVGLIVLFVAEPVYRAFVRNGEDEWLGLPHLRGVRVAHADAAWMRQLSAALAAAAEPGAPLLLLSRRNDINVFATSTPFWLSSRRSATRHHELHPGVTDTEPVQREMLAQVGRGPMPVVVREHRFNDNHLDVVKATIMTQVPVGSTLMDEWVDRHYESGPMFGIYEVMRKRSPGPLLVIANATER